MHPRIGRRDQGGALAAPEKLAVAAASAGGLQHQIVVLRGYRGDADDCVQRSYVRVLPSFARQTARPRSRPEPTWSIRPTGFRISIDEPEPGERGGKLRCVDAAGKVHFPAPQQRATSLRWGRLRAARSLTPRYAASTRS